MNTEVATRPELKVAFVLSPRFTLLAFASFVDTLRHAADEADRSRQIFCTWHVLGADMQPITSSCGVEVRPWKCYGDPRDYDYVVVVGGLLSAFQGHAPETFGYLRSAEQAGVGAVGLCTGVFALAEAGLLKDRLCCAHRQYDQALKVRYPDVRVVLGRSHLQDGDIYTCIGGAAPIKLALMLIARHCGHARARKAAEGVCSVFEGAGPGEMDAVFGGFERCGNRHVENAVALMRRYMASKLSVEALAKRLGISARYLSKVFDATTNMSPAEFWRRMSLDHARRLLLDTSLTITQIAFDAGFADAAHFTHAFRTVYGETPGRFRAARQLAASFKM